jgi:hypothetical protein
LSKVQIAKAEEEIEMGMSAVSRALGAPPAPFFRYMYLADSPDSLAYLARRNIAVFALDVDAFDYKITAADEIVKGIMSRLGTQGKGIVLLNDFQAGTASAMTRLLSELKAGDYRVVHMRAKTGGRTLQKYDNLVAQQNK